MLIVFDSSQHTRVLFVYYHGVLIISYCKVREKFKTLLFTGEFTKVVQKIVNEKFIANYSHAHEGIDIDKKFQRAGRLG